MGTLRGGNGGNRPPDNGGSPDPVPDLYFGGSSHEAGPVAARYSDVYLTWGEPPRAVDTKLRWMDSLAREAGRTLRYGIRLHVITRDTAHEAWLQASRLIEGVDEDMIRAVQQEQAQSESEVGRIGDTDEKARNFLAFESP